jgi:hypothetical protein
MSSAYIEFSFAVIMNLYMLDWSVAGLVMSNVYMIFHAVLILAYPIWMYCFYRKNYHKFGEENFAFKFG